MDSDFDDSEYEAGSAEYMSEEGGEYLTNDEDDEDIVLDTNAEVASAGRQVREPGRVIWLGGAMSGCAVPGTVKHCRDMAKTTRGDASAQARPSSRGERSRAMHLLHAQVRFRVMNEVELRDRQKEALSSVTSVLGIADSDAAKVLRAYKW